MFVRVRYVFGGLVNALSIAMRIGKLRVIFSQWMSLCSLQAEGLSGVSFLGS